MRFAPRVMAGLALLWLAGPAASAPADDERADIHGQMQLAGFAPLAEMRFGGRDVRRLLLLDPYGILPVPGLEIERHADGRVTLRTQHRGWTGPVFDLAPETWPRLAALESEAYAPRPAPRATGQPTAVVHCWAAFLEASPDRAALWSGCGGTRAGARAYVDAVIALAIAEMACPAGQSDALWRFVECTRAPRPLDDPALAAAFTALNADHDARQNEGAELLSRARAALKTAAATRAPEAIAAADEAVFAFGRHQQALHTLAQTGFAPFRKAELRGGADAAIIEQARRAWGQNLAAQDRNYIGLLEALARLRPLAQ